MIIVNTLFYAIEGVGLVFQGLEAVNNGIDFIAESSFRAYDVLKNIPNKIEQARIKETNAIRQKKYQETVNKIKEKYSQDIRSSENRRILKE